MFINLTHVRCHIAATIEPNADAECSKSFISLIQVPIAKLPSGGRVFSVQFWMSALVTNAQLGKSIWVVAHFNLRDWLTLKSSGTWATLSALLMMATLLHMVQLSLFSMSHQTSSLFMFPLSMKDKLGKPEKILIISLLLHNWGWTMLNIINRRELQRRIATEENSYPSKKIIFRFLSLIKR